MSESIEQLIRHQVSLWEESRRAQSSRQAVPSRWGRSICVSREFGAGGGQLAQELGRRLGLVVYDKEILQTIGTIGHIQDELLRSIDEQTRGWFADFLADLASGDASAHWRYQMHLANIIVSAAHYGECIFVGRGAHMLIPPSHRLSVRLVAPREFRLKRIMELESRSEGDAGELMESREKARRTFHEKNFGVDPNEPHHHDLVLNSGSFSPNVLVDLVRRAFLAKFPWSERSGEVENMTGRDEP